MPIRRIKDKRHLIAETRVRFKKHYFDCYLWKTKPSFDHNTHITEPDAMASCITAPIKIRYEKKKKTKELVGTVVVGPKLGEIHFIKDRWNTEVVAHELNHAQLHCIACFDPGLTMEDRDMDKEEEICYRFGGWVDKVYRWLWDHDPD